MEDERYTPHDWREWRRMRAWELSKEGWTSRDIAAALGVGRPAVCQWLAAAREGGPDGPLRRVQPGPAGELLPRPRLLIARSLWPGGEAHGLPGGGRARASGADSIP